MHRLLTVAALWFALTGTVAAQTASGLALHHGFPLAGSELSIVVEGFDASATVAVELDTESLDRAAPAPSLVAYLSSQPGSAGPELLFAQADAAGVVTLDIPLTHPDDAGGLIDLRLRSIDDGASVDVLLLVQPPMLLVPTSGGLARIDLRDGQQLLPRLPGADVSGLALSPDGLQSYVLRPGGRLEHRSFGPWSPSAASVRGFGRDSHGLAASRDAGPAFVVLRPEGDAFAPNGRLAFLDGRDELVVEPLGQRVDGRRWAVSPDGLTAFVAEDDLLVREIDLLSGRARLPFTAGFIGDAAIADMALVDERLMVLTRRTDGLPGALTVYDLRTGWVTPFTLAVDPRRLVDAGDRVLIVPRGGVRLTRVEDGVPVGFDELAGVDLELLDAAPVSDGAVVLARDGAGATRLLHWSLAAGLRGLPLDGNLPAVERVFGAGFDLAVLLGAADGVPWAVVPGEGRLFPVAGVVALPERDVHLLP